MSGLVGVCKKKDRVDPHLTVNHLFYPASLACSTFLSEGIMRLYVVMQPLHRQFWGTMWQSLAQFRSVASEVGV